jgi:hypothetical protein
LDAVNECCRAWITVRQITGTIKAQGSADGKQSSYLSGLFRFSLVAVATMATMDRRCGKTKVASIRGMA